MHLAVAWCDLFATTISWACFTDVTLGFKYRPENAAFATLDPSINEKMRTNYSRLGPMMVRYTDADSVSCVVQALILEP